MLICYYSHSQVVGWITFRFRKIHANYRSFMWNLLVMQNVCRGHKRANFKVNSIHALTAYQPMEIFIKCSADTLWLSLIVITCHEDKRRNRFSHKLQTLPESNIIIVNMWMCMRRTGFNEGQLYRHGFIHYAQTTEWLRCFLKFTRKWQQQVRAIVLHIL